MADQNLQKGQWRRVLKHRALRYVKSLSKEITLEGNQQLNIANSRKYSGHVISNNLSDESDFQAKVSFVWQEKYV